MSRGSARTISRPERPKISVVPTPKARRETRPAELPAFSDDGDTQVLMLRQVYLSKLTLGILPDAVRLARRMTEEQSSLRDLAFHDLSRAELAQGHYVEAVNALRQASRAAPASRRSFHLWSLATVQQFAGRYREALRTLRRALLWAGRDRPLIRAQIAYVSLEAGIACSDIEQIRRTLQKSRCREGYGQFLLGMIAWHIHDYAHALAHLRAFLRRNASLDVAKALTMQEELMRARTVVAKLASS